MCMSSRGCSNGNPCNSGPGKHGFLVLELRSHCDAHAGISHDIICGGRAMGPWEEKGNGEEGHLRKSFDDFA